MADTNLQQESLAQEAAIQEAQLQEAEYANRLAFEQEQATIATSAIQQEGLSFGKASLLKYMIILLVFAIPNDAIDAIDLTGIGMVVSWFISLFLSVSTIFVTWFFNSELNRVKDHMSKVENHKKTLAKAATRISSKLSKFAPKNPVIKVVAGTVLEMIPIISILPWSSICVLLAYWDERSAFKEARKHSEELSTAPDVYPEYA